MKQKINEVKISQNGWNKKHWKAISLNYSKAKFFKDYKNLFEYLYLDANDLYLSEINYKFISAINKILNINTKIRHSSQFNLIKGKSERLLDICKSCNADIYISGPTAKGYIDTSLFKKEGVKVEWIDYSGYPEYNQLYPPLEHQVSIIDLIFNEGPNAKKFMKSFKITKSGDLSG